MKQPGLLRGALALLATLATVSADGTPHRPEEAALIRSLTGAR